ncbi:MAG: rhodanese-like domain-containing protein [Tissierellia bacterium]|nr:rhodanese-like domain-containing protein [Tissierellia bacterium]
MNYLLLLILLAVVFFYLKNRGGDAVSMEELEQALADKKTVVDVRSWEEYKSGHIPGAISLPVQDLEKRAKRKLGNFDNEIYLYCQSGARSRRGKQILENMGYQKVKNFGAISTWTKKLEK